MIERRYVILCGGKDSVHRLDRNLYSKEDADAEAERRRVLGWTMTVVSEREWEISWATYLVELHQKNVADAQRALDEAVKKLRNAEALP